MEWRGWVSLLAPETGIEGTGERSIPWGKPHGSPFIAASALLLQQCFLPFWLHQPTISDICSVPSTGATQWHHRGAYRESDRFCWVSSGLCEAEEHQVKLHRMTWRTVPISVHCQLGISWYHIHSEGCSTSSVMEHEGPT